MTEDIPPKYLAKNIPEDLVGCCDRIKVQLLSQSQKWRRPNVNYERLYGQLFRSLSDEDLSHPKMSQIGNEIDEIQVRFIAVQKTLDYSLPARPVYQDLRSLQNSLVRITNKLDDPDRDQVVETLHGETEELRALGLSERFDAASSLAEKVGVVHAYLEAINEDLGRVVDFFDYKRGLVTKGQPSKYATVYAVHALADLFERQNTRGHKASVNQSVDDGRHGRRGSRANLHRYTGSFLDFVLGFLWQVVPEQVSTRSHEGIADQIRAMAQRRKADPEMFRLLHGDVSTEDVLEFMTRADALK